MKFNVKLSKLAMYMSPLTKLEQNAHFFDERWSKKHHTNTRKPLVFNHLFHIIVMLCYIYVLAFAAGRELWVSKICICHNPPYILEPLFSTHKKQTVPTG